MAEQKIYSSQISGGANLNPNSSPYQNFVPPVSAFEGSGKAISDGLLTLGKPLINLYDQTQEAQAKAWTANKLKEVQLSYQDKFAANEIQTKDGFDKTWQQTVKEIDDAVPNGRAQGMIKNHLNSLQLGYRQDAINIQNRNARNVIAGQTREFIDKNTMEAVDARTSNERVYQLADEVNNFSNSMLKTGTFTPEGATAINMQTVGFLRNTLSARAENPITARSMLEIVGEDGRLPRLTWEESQPLIAKAKLTDVSDKMTAAMPATMQAEVEKLKPSSDSKMPMEMQEQLYNNAQRMMDANLKAIQKDPTAYLNQQPDVTFARNAYDSDWQMYKQAELQNKSPMSEVNEDMNRLKLNLDKSRDLYFNSLAKKQDELGIPTYEQKFVSESGKQGILNAFSRATASGSQAEISRTVEEIKEKYGSHYPSVMASLGDMEPKISILSSLNGQELQSFSNYMFSTREKGSMEKIQSQIATIDRNTIEDAIDNDFMDYEKAILATHGVGGANYSAAMKQEVKNYAKYLLASGQATKSNAAQKALDSTAKHTHLIEEVSSGSIPTMIPRAYEQDRDLIKESLSQEFNNLTNPEMWKDKSHPLLAGGKGEYGGNKNKTFDITEDLEKNGYWSMMPNEKGWVLMSKDRMGIPYVVRDSQGKNIEKLFSDLKSTKKPLTKKETINQKAKASLENTKFLTE